MLQALIQLLASLCRWQARHQQGRLTSSARTRSLPLPHTFSSGWQALRCSPPSRCRDREPGSRGTAGTPTSTSVGDPSSPSPSGGELPLPRPRRLHSCSSVACWRFPPPPRARLRPPNSLRLCLQTRERLFRRAGARPGAAQRGAPTPARPKAGGWKVVLPGCPRAPAPAAAAQVRDHLRSPVQQQRQEMHELQPWLQKTLKANRMIHRRKLKAKHEMGQQ